MNYSKIGLLLVLLQVSVYVQGQSDTHPRQQETAVDSVRDYFEMRFKTLRSEIKKYPLDTVRNYSAFGRLLKFSGLVQSRYTVSANRNMDVNSSYFPDSVKGVTNSFSMRRVRFLINAKINDHFDAIILANFADLEGNPSNKLLEFAYIQYHHGDAFHVIAGQYRPFIGIENAMPIDILQTFDFTNAYNAFTNNGWQNFQEGIAVYGTVPGTQNHPWRYYTGLINGNGRNQVMDNDNGKHGYLRIEHDLRKNITLGINGGLGSVNNKQGYMYGADMKSGFPLGERWHLDLSAEYKEGTNFVAYSSYTGTQALPLNRFRMRGFYVLPDLKYYLLTPRLRSIDLSSRYEYFDESFRLEKNPHQTLTPLMGLEFADGNFAMLQLGANIDIYKHQVKGVSQLNHSLFIAQLQVRF